VNKLISIKEASALAGVSTHTFRRWIKAGIISAIKITSRTVRIDPTELESVIFKKKTINAAAGVSSRSVYVMSEIANRNEDQNDNQSVLMSRIDAAKHFGIGRQTLIRFEKRGFLTPLRLGPRKVYYRRDKIESLIEGWEKDGRINAQ